MNVDYLVLYIKETSHKTMTKPQERHKHTMRLNN